MISRNGFNYFTLQHQSHGPFSFARGLHAHFLGLNVSKKFTLSSGFYKPSSSLVFGSTKFNAIASSEEEEKEKEVKDESNQRDEELLFEPDFAETILPPWGNLDSASESDQPEIIPKAKVMMSVDNSNVHFLEETDEETLSKRILTLSRTNKPRSAIELLGSMELSGLRPGPHALNSLMSCLLRNGLSRDAARLFGFMKSRELTTGHSFGLALKAVAGARGHRAALRTFSRMEAEAENGFDAVVYNTMISLCARENDWAGALRVWRSMDENGLTRTHVTYSVLVCTFARSGRDELALEAYSAMARAGLEPGRDEMQAVIGSGAREGEWESALGVFRDMLRRGLVPSAISCNALINALGRAGEVGPASQVFGAMRSLGHPPDSYTWGAILRAFHGADRHEDALRVFERVSMESRPSLHLYNAALISCSKLGMWDRALQLMWRMEEDGGGVEPSTESYNLVIGACETARRPDVAVQVYERMAHRKCEPDTFTHLLMIRVCIWGSMWNKVEEILYRASSDASLYNAVIQGMCLRGKVDSAKKLYSKMRNLGLQPDGKTRALMLQNLRQNSVGHKFRQPSRRRRKGTALTSLSL